MAGVAFEDVTKAYSDGTKAVDDLNLEIADGEFMVLVGPSGCGKTTALRMAAGRLEEISSGVVRIGDRVVNYVPSRNRGIAMVPSYVRPEGWSGSAGVCYGSECEAPNGTWLSGRAVASHLNVWLGPDDGSGSAALNADEIRSKLL